MIVGTKETGLVVAGVVRVIFRILHLGHKGVGILDSRIYLCPRGINLCGTCIVPVPHREIGSGCSVEIAQVIASGKHQRIVVAVKFLVVDHSVAARQTVENLGLRGIRSILYDDRFHVKETAGGQKERKGGSR